MDGEQLRRTQLSSVQSWNKTIFLFVCLQIIVAWYSTHSSVGTNSWRSSVSLPCQSSQVSHVQGSSSGNVSSWLRFQPRNTVHYSIPLREEFKKSLRVYTKWFAKQFCKYQPSSAGDTRSPPAKSKMAASGPQNGRRDLERCLPLGFWAF